jgi:hypothetical protein
MDTHMAILEAAKRKLSDTVKTLRRDALQALLAIILPKKPMRISWNYT